MKPAVKAFFDKSTSTLTYVTYDPQSRDGVVLDPVWDYDPATSKLTPESVNAALEFIRENKLKIHYILETHAHADHVSGAQLLRERLPSSKVAIGASIQEVQRTFRDVFNLDPAFPVDGRQFDELVKEGSPVRAGTLEIGTISTPGHTPACSSYLIGDCLFTGDTLFMPDCGTGRCDFPAGSADHLYTSVHEKLYKLPDETRVFVGHDYQPGGRPLAFESTIGEQKRANVHLKESTSRDQFVSFRMERDKTLSAPRLLLPSIQLNIRAGRLPEAESNGTCYLKIPLILQAGR
ncbi:MAG: MBL fold metallo-hydrolase [Bdellovibrionales bacterium]